MPLTEQVKKLISLSRIVSFARWKNSELDSVINIFQAADDQGRYLSDSDLASIKSLVPSLRDALEVAQLLRDKAPEIVDYARQQVLNKYPGITENGGDLYPPERAEACWRDFWHFLLCISYGVAGQTIPFTSPEGLKNMQLLYQELRVPLPAMMLGLEALKSYSLEQFNDSVQIELSSYFDHLIVAMKQFT